MFSTTLPAGRRRRRAARLALAATIALVALTGCAAAPGTTTASSSASVQSEEGAFPTTVTHALGETKIPAEPQRIAVIGWSTPDVVAALGYVPIAVGKNDYGADAEGHFPWFRDEVEKLGGTMPVALPSLERGEINFEALLETGPDLILATYSGITEEDYRRLSAIAPTVGYPKQSWATPLNENIALVGQALGVPERARELQGTLDRTIAEAAAAHPEFAGVSFAYGTAPAEDGMLLLNGPADSRVQLLEQLGLTLDPRVGELAATSGESSSFTVSLEQISSLTPELFITNVANDAEWTTSLANSSVFANWGPVGAGNVVVTSDNALTMAMSSPSPLSIMWGLDRFVEPLAAVVADAR